MPYSRVMSLCLLLLAGGCKSAPQGDAICELDQDTIDAYDSADNNVFPDIAWTGTSALLVWTQVPPDLTPGTVWLRPLGEDGSLANTAPTIVADTVATDRAQIVWTGESAVVVWVSHDGEDCIMSRSFDASGAPLGPAEELYCTEDTNGVPSMAVEEDGGIALLWTAEVEEDTAEAYLLRLNATGHTTSTPTRVALPQPPYSGVRLASDAQGLVLAWEDESGISVGRVEASGSITSLSVVEPAPPGSMLVSLATDGSAVTWTENADGAKVIHFADLNDMSASGDLIVSGEEQFVVMPSNLVADPDQGLRAISWTDGNAIDETSIHLGVVDAQSLLAMSHTLVSDVDESQQLESSVNTVPGGFLVAWRSSIFHERDTIRVQKVRCHAD